MQYGESLWQVFLAAVLTQNIALSFHLGMCPLISMSKKLRASFDMGVVVTGVMVLTSTFNWAARRYVLLPMDFEFMEFTVFIVSTAGIVQLLEGVIERFFPALHRDFGVFLALVTVNCAVMGVSVLASAREYALLTTAVFALGCGIGWTLVIVLMTAARMSLIFSAPSKSLGESGVAMLLAAAMAMAFAGFRGFV